MYINCGSVDEHTTVVFSETPKPDQNYLVRVHTVVVLNRTSNFTSLQVILVIIQVKKYFMAFNIYY